MVYERTIIELAGLLHLDLSLLFFAYRLSGIAFEVTLLLCTTFSVFFMFHFRASKLNSIGAYGKWCLG